MEIKNSVVLNKYSHNIRFSQVISPFGIGAIIDFIDQSLMVANTDYWEVSESQEIHDKRLENLLGVEKFYLPPMISQQNKIPLVRFPRWYFCPRCKRLKPLEEWAEDYVPRKNSKNKYMIKPWCSECNLLLVPAGILVACEHGHIDDFPWSEWVHAKSKKTICSKKPKLKIKNSSSALGLEGLVVECSCGAKANLKGAFSEGAFNTEFFKHKCSGYQPWKGEREVCNNIPRAIQSGASNVYFPKVISSIVIPPFSSEINLIVQNSRKYKTLLEVLDDEEYVNSKGKDRIIEEYVDKIAKDIHRNKDIVKIIIDNNLKGTDEEKEQTKEQYRVEEYNALIGKIPEECMNELDFKIELQKNIEDYNIPQISKVTLVKKLREVRALVGFSRLTPISGDVVSGFNKNDDKRFVSVRHSEEKWFPAYEARGEGIFIELDDIKIQEWIEKNKNIVFRINQLEKRYNKVQRDRKNKERKITPKFVLLHTFAHLLIKELSFQCGYDSAALTERIFCNTEESTENMSGILIYTSSGDAEGTLGGLVRQGKCDMLPNIIYNAVKKAMWCSLDPVCIESKAQGRDGLNIAACHACTLISETSCEEFNNLLDRGLIVGDFNNREFGFFSNLFD